MATAFVAMAISIMSFGEERMLMTKLVVAVACMGTSFVIFVPMTYLVLASRWRWIWLVVFTTVPFSIGYIIVSVFEVGLSVSFWMGIGMTASFCALILSYGIGLIVLRYSGGRLATSTIESPPVV